MNRDGSAQKAITKMGAMSWAPYFHPSGDYLIFTTNLQGFANFELYLADLRSDTPPVRVTWTDGFDGLPVFTPDGKQLCWTSNRTSDKQSQLFIADWNHEFAQEMVRQTAAVAELPASAGMGSLRPLGPHSLGGWFLCLIGKPPVLHWPQFE